MSYYIAMNNVVQIIYQSIELDQYVLPIKQKDQSIYKERAHTYNMNCELST